jgi:prolipoprotein diacylglyceryltransferase
VSFPADSVAHQELTSVGLVVSGADRTVPLHPTQLYEAAGELIIFVILLLVRRRWARTAEVAEHQMPARNIDPRRSGGLILLYAGAYAALRFGVEIFRGDSARRYLFEWAAPGLARVLALPPDQPLLLSVSQAISLLVLAAVGVTFGARARALRLGRTPFFSAPGR